MELMICKLILEPTATFIHRIPENQKNRILNLNTIEQPMTKKIEITRVRNNGICI